MSLIQILFVFISIIISFLYFIHSKYNNYWKNKNIPHIKTFKKFLDIFFYKKCPAIVFDEIYKDPVTKEEPIVGVHIFHRPALVIKDPELIKNVLIKDFLNFQDRFSNADPHKDLLGSNNLFLKRNPQWKNIRSKLTPVFTSGKIKQMFSLANELGKQLDKHICSLTENNLNKSEQDVKKIAQLYTIDFIASIAYGINANSMSNPEAEFLKHGKEIFHFNRWRSFEFCSMFFLPDLVSLFGFKAFTKKATEFLTKTFKYIMEERKRTSIIRNDLIDALLTIQKQQKDETDKSKVLEEITLIAQAATFFTAGFETSSTTMSFALWEIAKNLEVQNRLRREIKEVLEQNNGELTYELIQNMEYLNMVIQETLRLYPVLPFLDRIYQHPEGKEYVFSSLGKSIKSGTPIYIPVYSIHRDEKYFKRANNFDPERFSVGNRDKIVPYSYMPFGLGPRNCIGDRIGLLQTKIGLVYFLKNHSIEMSERTLGEIKLEKKALLLQMEGGTFCNLVRNKLSNNE